MIEYSLIFDLYLWSWPAIQVIHMIWLLFDQNTKLISIYK